MPISFPIRATSPSRCCHKEELAPTGEADLRLEEHVRNTCVDREVVKGDLPFKNAIRIALFDLCRQTAAFVNRKLIARHFPFVEMIFCQDPYSDILIVFKDLQSSSPPSIHAPAYILDQEPEVCLIYPLP